MRKPEYELYVEYSGGISPSIDAKIIKTVGKEPDSSGCMTVGAGERDMQFYFGRLSAVTRHAAKLDGKVIDGRTITARLG